MRARTVYLPVAAFAVVMVAGPAFAANWSTTGIGTAAVKANALVPPGAGSTSGPTTSSLVITWSAGNVGGFAGSAAPTGYEVLRGGVLIGAGGCASATTRATTAVTCTDDNGLSPGQPYTYTVRAIRGANWVGATNTQFGGTTATTPTFAVTSVAYTGGNQKAAFSGTGGTAGATVSVTVCKVSTYPCAAVNVQETVAATVSANGTWTTAQTANMASSTNFWARAVQATPAATSAVFGPFQCAAGACA
jgi:hypothetical protein